MTILLLLPAVGLIAFFYVAPAIVTVFFSMTDMSLIGEKAEAWSFVALDNYVFMFKDPYFYTSLLNTVVFLVFSAIIGQQVLGFVIAFFMQKKHPAFRSVVGTCVLLGWITPEVVVAFMAYAFFNVEGSLNSVLGLFGLKGQAWLFKFALPSVIVANIWRGTAFSMLMFQSALDQVSDSVLEAAIVDGANRLQSLWYVLLPELRGTILTNTVLITMPTMGVFGLIYALTGGGPGSSTTTLPIFMYKNAIVSFEFGYGTAIAVMLLTFGMLLSVFYIRTFQERR
jgi:multiple sugar transport system permease protein